MNSAGQEIVEIGNTQGLQRLSADFNENERICGVWGNETLKAGAISGEFGFLISKLE